MPTANDLVATLKELLSAGNPGLVTREELAALEDRLDELLRLLDEIEARLPINSDASTGKT